jgi:hypothetical protein
MPRKSSTFIRATRESEAWLPTFAELEDGATPEQAEEALAAAALLRGTVEGIEVPPEAEALSRELGTNELQKGEFGRGKGSPGAQLRKKLDGAVRGILRRPKQEE